MAAQAARTAEPSLAADRAGYGGFGAWVAAQISDLPYSSKPSPGYIWDPARFDAANLANFRDRRLSDLQAQVVRVTDIPGLTQSAYAALLTALAEDVSGHAFDRTETSKRVRDRCQNQGEAISRSAVNFVIQGLLYAGVQLSEKPPLDQLAAKWADNVLALCRGARMELDDAQRAEIHHWAAGGLVAEPGNGGA